MIKYLKSRGFTDRLYFLNLTLSWLFIITCVVLTVAVGPNLDIVAYGTPAIFTELSIHTGYIVWKAKHENISKYGGNLNERYYDDHIESCSICSDDTDYGISDTADDTEA